jgi:glyoxylase-like metal-dependent hydrolase (beta-lactamase superfamily II)
VATIHPVVDEGLGNSAYVVELGDGRALVIDPARDPTPYLALARWRRLQIAYAAETHLHADFLTGSRELAATAGAEILAPRTSRLASPTGGWRTARRSTSAGSPCGRWPPQGTHPNMSVTCSWTTANRWRCSVAGRCWSAPWLAPTWPARS